MSEANESVEVFADENKTDNIKEVTKLEENTERQKIPRHLRFRYWHSWEELRLVELWKKHFDEITTLDQNLPIFRTICLGMKDSGFHLNGQEVRRKINGIKNKYIAERRRLIDSGESESNSTWRLYPLIRCLMNPKQNNNQTSHIERTLPMILEKNQADPLFHVLMSGLPVKETLQKVECGEMQTPEPMQQLESCFPVENKVLAESIAHAYGNKDRLSYTPRNQRPCELKAQQAKLLSAQSSNMTTPRGQTQQQVVAKTKPSAGILKRYATLESIKEIRLENLRLVEESIIASKLLRREEQLLKSYEHMVKKIHSQYLNFSTKIDKT